MGLDNFAEIEAFVTICLCESLWLFWITVTKFLVFLVLWPIFCILLPFFLHIFLCCLPSQVSGTDKERCPHLLYYQCNVLSYTAKGILWLLFQPDFINIFWAFRPCLHLLINIHHSAPQGSDLWSYCGAAAGSMPLSLSQLFPWISFHLILDLYNRKIYH